SENIAKVCKNIVHILRATTAAIGKGRMAEAIVLSPFLSIAQNLIGTSGFFELFFGLGIAGIFIRMKLHRQFAIGFLDGIRIGVTSNAQNLVIIPLTRHIIPWFAILISEQRI